MKKPIAYFAWSILSIFLGMTCLIAGLRAITFLSENSKLNPSSSGWVLFLSVGALLCLSGFLLIKRYQWSRVLNCVSAFVFAIALTLNFVSGILLLLIAYFSLYNKKSTAYFQAPINEKLP